MPSCPQAKSLIAAGLESRILLPNNPDYEARKSSYFDNAAKVDAACIVQPRTAGEVATAVKALAAAEQVFAVRAGGYTNRHGSSNIEGGVTIDLGCLNSVDYEPATELAHLGPGATWQMVYDGLEKHNRIAVGARVANVGVGGYLLGGGISIYLGRYGFACDNIVSCEIALANGTVVTASSEQHPDLFRVLKGGGNNFGIVTRFTVKTFPIQSPVWGGVALKSADVAPDAAKVLQDFTSNVANDPDSTVILGAGYQPAHGGDAVLALCFNAAGVEKPAAFSGFDELPDVFSKYHRGKAQELLPFAEMPLDHFNIWYTLTVKNDAAVVAKAAELQNAMAKDFQVKIPNNEFTTHVVFQPIPRGVTEKSVAAGGNVFGLDSYTHDAVMLQAGASVKTAELAGWADSRVKALLEDLRAFAGEDRLCPWLYLNYAHGSQKVLESYGVDNVRRIKEAAAKYDPEGVFQKFWSGGFKISAVNV